MITVADLSNPSHQAAIRTLTAEYAREGVALGEDLPAEILDRLPAALAEHPTTIVFLAFDGDAPIGMATCFVGFSTFSAGPLINIHDLVVTDSMRGRGVGHELLAAVERHAQSMGCCKVTLEVATENRARRLYADAGFVEDSIFCVKKLT